MRLKLPTRSQTVRPVLGWIYIGLFAFAWSVVFLAVDYETIESVLHTGLDGKRLGFAMALLPFNLMMLALWNAIAQFLLKLRRPIQAGAATISESGDLVRVRMTWGTPLSTGLAMSGGLAILGFVLTESVPTAASMATACVAWTVILAGGMLVAVKFQLSIARGNYDLLIDQRQRVLALSPTFGRSDKIVIPITDVRAVEVVAGRRRGSVNFAPSLVVSDSAGAVRKETLAEWPEHSDAAEFASWLRERLKLEEKRDART
jgi:hypothetical protein